jgi:hypothetical protein
VSGREVMRVMRALVLGETWVLPLAIAGTVAIAAGSRVAMGEAWFESNGCFVVLALVVSALGGSVQSRRGR